MTPEERTNILDKAEIMTLKGFPLLDVLREVKSVIVDMNEEIVAARVPEQLDLKLVVA